MKKHPNSLVVLAIAFLTIINSTLWSSEKSIKPIAHYNKKKFAYLGSKTFQERHALAMEWIGDCPTIIEIGGGSNSLGAHLSNTQKIIVIDPTIKNRNEGNLIHIAKKFEDWKIEENIKRQRYAVVILGLDLSNMPMHGWNKLYDLINESDKTVIEYSATFRPAKKQSNDILKSVTKKKFAEKEFDFSHADELKTEKYNNNVNAYFRKMYLLTETS